MYAVIPLHSCDDHLQVEQLLQTRMNMGTFLVFVMSGKKPILFKRTVTTFLPSPGSIVFITSFMMLNTMPMFHRTFPVQDLIEN